MWPQVTAIPKLEQSASTKHIAWQSLCCLKTVCCAPAVYPSAPRNVVCIHVCVHLSIMTIHGSVWILLSVLGLGRTSSSSGNAGGFSGRWTVWLCSASPEQSEATLSEGVPFLGLRPHYGKNPEVVQSRVNPG